MYTFKRNGIYYVEYFDDLLGKNRRVSTRTKTLSEANEFILKLNNSEGSKNHVYPLSLIGFRNEYEDYAKTSFSKKYQININLSFRKFIEHVGNPEISSISHRSAEQFLLKVFQEKKYSAYMYYRTLKAAFNKAIRWNILTINPFVNISLPKINKQIPIFITTKELNKILRLTSNVKLRILYKTAFYTGMRLSEIANLKWDSIDFASKIIKVQISDEFVTKSRKERIIPINKKIYNDLIKLSNTRSCEYIFANDRKYKYDTSYISHKFKRIIRQLGLSERIRFHTLRHSFASNLIQNGANLYVVKELLGHESITTTQIYSHLDSKSLMNAVKLL